MELPKLHKVHKVSCVHHFPPPFSYSPFSFWLLYFWIIGETFVGLRPRRCGKLSPNFQTFKEPRNRFQGTDPPACSLAGWYDSPIPTRFLAPIDCLKIPTLYFGVDYEIRWDRLQHRVPYPTFLFEYSLWLHKQVFRLSISRVPGEKRWVVSGEGSRRSSSLFSFLRLISSGE